MPGVTSGQRLRARDVRVLGFIVLHSGKKTQEEIEDEIQESRFFIRESLERLAFFKKISIDGETKLVTAVEQAPRQPRTERRLPNDDVHHGETASASKAIRSALAGPFPQLRKAAVEVLRTAFLRGETLAERARYLGTSPGMLSQLRKDFPEYWADAENRIGPRMRA